MKGENNIFLRGMNTVPVPWQHKVINAGPDRRDVIADYEGNHICTLEPTNENFRPEQYRRTYALIAHAPLLLAALTEYALEQDVQGKLTEKLAALLRDAGGIDVTHRAQQPVKQDPQPKIWDNASQSLKDNVSETTVKKPPRPLPGS